jgi:hypothetical protein
VFFSQRVGDFEEMDQAMSSIVSAAAVGAAPMAEVHEREVRPLLDLIDELRGLGIEKDLPIPQVRL